MSAITTSFQDILDRTSLSVKNTYQNTKNWCETHPMFVRNVGRVAKSGLFAITACGIYSLIKQSESCESLRKTLDMHRINVLTHFVNLGREKNILPVENVIEVAKVVEVIEVIEVAKVVELVGAKFVETICAMSDAAKCAMLDAAKIGYEWIANMDQNPLSNVRFPTIDLSWIGDSYIPYDL